MEIKAEHQHQKKSATQIKLEKQILKSFGLRGFVLVGFQKDGIMIATNTSKGVTGMQLICAAKASQDHFAGLAAEGMVRTMMRQAIKKDGK